MHQAVCDNVTILLYTFYLNVAHIITPTMVSLAKTEYAKWNANEQPIPKNWLNQISLLTTENKYEQN